MVPTLQSLPARVSALGPTLQVRRALPQPRPRTVGPWCFLDHFGPVSLQARDLAVGPHPHIGLQTVTWLVDGEVVHGDSLGNRQPIRPGQLNLMTAGRGIAHWEIPEHEGARTMHGVQLWLALPDAVRQGDPHFEHHARLPVDQVGDARVTVLVGRLAGLRSPAITWWPTVGAEVQLSGPGRARLPLDRRCEHALVLLEGHLQVEGQRLEPGALHLLGGGREAIEVAATEATRAMLVGGEPWTEPLLMWWNFVARTPEEIARARADWEAGEGFGDPAAWPGRRIPAPPLPERGLRLRA